MTDIEQFFGEFFDPEWFAMNNEEILCGIENPETCESCQ